MAPKKYQPVSVAIPNPVGGSAGVNATLVAILMFWAAIVLYSIGVAALCPGTHWWAMIAHYVAGMAGFYAWHWQAHRHIKWIPFNKRCVEMHMEHHWSLYPPNKYFGDTEQQLQVTHESFFTAHEALLYVFFFIILAVAKWICHQSWEALAFALLLDGVLGYAGNYLHQSFHVKGHWFERFAAFHELRAVHYVHHLGSTKINYAVFNIGLDWLFGTLLLERPVIRKEHEQIERSEKQFVSSLGGLATLALGLQLVPRHNANTNGALERGLVPMLFRAAIVAAMILVWRESQKWSPPAAGHTTTSHSDWFFQVIPATQSPAWLLETYGFAVDATAVVLLVSCVLGTSIRPILALLYGYTLRQLLITAGSCASPAESLWATPHRYTALLASFDHAESALSGGLLNAMVLVHEVRKWSRGSRRAIANVGILLIMAYHVYCLVALRAEWTSDIILSVVVGSYVCVVADRHSSVVESWLP